MVFEARLSPAPWGPSRCQSVWADQQHEGGHRSPYCTPCVTSSMCRRTARHASGRSTVAPCLFSPTDISKNKLTALPDDIGFFEELEVLNCYHNRIFHLPDLSALSQLTKLNLRCVCVERSGTQAVICCG